MIRAVLDADVLYPLPLRDTLLSGFGRQDMECLVVVPSNPSAWRHQLKFERAPQ